MPTPSPGLKRVPRWRTMISPPDTVSPANTFTPRRLAFESRPLRLEPRPFLCAIASLLPDLRDSQAGELLAMARAALVAALGLELEDPELGPALVADDLGPHRRLCELGAVEHRIAVAGQQQRNEVDRRAGLIGQPLDEQGLTLLDAVLLAACLDDCVGHISETHSSAEAFARERRRPPLRPRRRGREDSASSPLSDPFSASSAAAGAVPASGVSWAVSAATASASTLAASSSGLVDRLRRRPRGGFGSSLSSDGFGLAAVFRAGLSVFSAAGWGLAASSRALRDAAPR